MAEPRGPWPFGAQQRVDTEAAMLEKVGSMYKTLQSDRDDLDLLARYADGDQKAPHIPNTADPTTRLLAERSVKNLTRLAVHIPAQISFIDGYSRDDELNPPEWEVWHRSNMVAKQTRLYIASLTYGAGYTMLSNIGTDKRRIDLLSSRDTIAFFEDTINDVVPLYALTIKSYPNGDLPGRALYMDSERVVHLDYTTSGEFKMAKDGDQPHSLGMTPMVRWPALLDDRGSAQGVVEGLMTAQDRINQASFDTLVTASFGAYKIRTAAGLVGEPVFDEDGMPVVDAAGKQVYRPIPVSQSRMLTTDDPNAKFGTLDETPLDGFIEAEDSAIKHFAVQAQLPPHALLGPMANLSAETLQAAMSQTLRFTHMLKNSWADACRTMMQIVAKDMKLDVDVYTCEVRWRDMSDHTLAAIVDALGKGSEMLQIPGRALWSRFPGATDSEIRKWEQIRDEEMAYGAFDDPQSVESAVTRETGAIDTQAAVPTPREVFSR